MRIRRVFPFILVVSLCAAGPEEEAQPPKEEPKPVPEQVAAAAGKLAIEDPQIVMDKFEAMEVIARSGDKERIPVLFQAAVTTQEPGVAVRAGEIANALDPGLAFRTFDQMRRGLKKSGWVNAVRFLGEIRSDSAAAALVEISKSKDVYARVEALYGIVKQKDPGLNAHLVSALKSNEVDVRVPAAVCCGLAKAKEAIDGLVSGLEDDAGDYAFFCAWALGQMKDPAILARVIGASKGKMSGAIGFAKAKAIVECSFDKQAHIPLLLKLADSGDELIAGAAANALGALGEGNPDAIRALLSLALRNKPEILSNLATDALGRIGGPEQGEEILRRFENNPGNIPPHMVKALGLLKTSKAAGFLLHIATTAKETSKRKRAAIAFWKCADETARKEFQAKLEAATQDNQIAGLCLVLGFDHSEAGFQFALTLLRRYYGKKLVEYARDALERMTGHRFAPAGTIWQEWFQKNKDFFDKKPQLLNRDEWRKQVLSSKEEMGISKATEEAVELGLGWLSRHQSLDGRWSGDKFPDHCALYYGKKCQIGARLGDWDLGMTGIALLAFYGAGYRPMEGRYKDTVLRAQIYCAARQWADGDFGGQGDLIGGYTRPIAAIALSEAYGTTSDPEYLERSWRSVSHIIRIQYDDAGWRYRLGGQFPGDTSVTGWNAWAIATARKFGVAVDPLGLEGANSLIDSFSSPVTEDEEWYDTDPRYFFEVGRGQRFEHFTGYNAREASRPPMTALGLMCKIMMDRRRSHPYCIGAANTLLKNVPEYDERANKIKYTQGAEYPVYYYYYGSLAMYQMGGSFWRRWSRPLLTEGIPKTQVKGDVCERGSWACDNLDSIGGRVYTTAMSVLTMETFYRYLPILQGR